MLISSRIGVSDRCIAFYWDVKTVVLGDVVSLSPPEGKPQGQIHNIISQLIYIKHLIIVGWAICGSTSMSRELNFDKFNGNHKF
jgi:hypothetical protein